MSLLMYIQSGSLRVKSSRVLILVYIFSFSLVVSSYAHSHCSLFHVGEMHGELVVAGYLVREEIRENIDLIN